MVQLTDILDRVKKYHAGANLDLINRAYVYSAKMHDGQLRKSGDAYFIHPVGVAGIIAQMKLDTASVCAALLHDVVEDTGVSEEELRKQFGPEVAFLVEGVTKLGKVNFTSKEDRQAESFRKMLVAMARDIRVLLVKLADRLDNMRTLEHMSPEAQERIAHETMDIYAPLAGRLGIQWLKSELEDLSFMYLHPEAYAMVAEKLRQTAKDADKRIKLVVNELHVLMREAGMKAEAYGRLKHPYSIYRKMRENNCEYEQVHDIMAFRVQVESLADCYGALGVIHSHWTPIPGRFKDYIALPKSNMYQSLHTTLMGPQHRRLEIQIRTHAMHNTAEMGIAAHWNYKEAGVDSKDAAKFKWLRQLMEFQNEVSDPEEFLDGVKVDLFSDEVYVFTPKGDVRVFPRGSTPVDFAYAVHSEIGDHCTGARVNGAIVPLKYKMHNGDTVEILTNSKQHPSKDWLTFVVSARARTRIRTYVRSEERKRSIKLGRDVLEREMHHREMSLNRLLKSPEELKKVLATARVGTEEELFAEVGYGKLSAAQIVEELMPKADSVTPNPLRPGLIEKTVRKVTGKDSDDGIVINDISDVLVRFAKCCNPLTGDPVTGWITRGRGVTVHRRGCARSMELEPERRLAVRWSTSTKVSRPVVLRVVTNDRPGMLASLSGEFTTAKLNITEATCRSGTDGRAVNSFHFNVSDVTTLRDLMRRLSRVDGVFEVERV